MYLKDTKEEPLLIAEIQKYLFQGKEREGV